MKTMKMFCQMNKGKVLTTKCLKTVFMITYHTSYHVKGSLVVLGNLRHNNPPPKEYKQIESKYVIINKIYEICKITTNL